MLLGGTSCSLTGTITHSVWHEKTCCDGGVADEYNGSKCVDAYGYAYANCTAIPIMGSWVDVVKDFFSTYIFGLSYEGGVTLTGNLLGCSDTYFDDDVCASGVDGTAAASVQVTGDASVTFTVTGVTVGSADLSGFVNDNLQYLWVGDCCDPSASLNSESYRGCITLDVSVLSHHWDPVLYGPCGS